MQDRHSPQTRKSLLATHGRTIHWVSRVRWIRHRRSRHVRFPPKSALCHNRTHALQQTTRTGYLWIISSARVSSGSPRNIRLPNRWRVACRASPSGSLDSPTAEQESAGDEQGRSLAENFPVRCTATLIGPSTAVCIKLLHATRAQSQGYGRFQKRLLPPPSDRSINAKLRSSRAPGHGDSFAKT